MKVLTNTALVALLAGSIGLAGLVPTLAAPDSGAAPRDRAAASQFIGHQHHRMGLSHPGMRGDRSPGIGMALMRIGCSDRSGEALEIAFVRAKYDLKLDATQQPLLDALESAALADQKSFAATCKTALGAGDAAKSATLLDRLETGLTLSQAKTTALNDIVPKFKTFYDSLTPDQQAKLNAHTTRGGRGGPWRHRTGGPAMTAPDATAPDSTMQPNSTVPSTTPDKPAPSST